MSAVMLAFILLPSSEVATLRKEAAIPAPTLYFSLTRIEKPFRNSSETLHSATVPLPF
jgi:hypothetical protein